VAVGPFTTGERRITFAFASRSWTDPAVPITGSLNVTVIAFGEMLMVDPSDGELAISCACAAAGSMKRIGDTRMVIMAVTADRMCRILGDNGGYKVLIIV